MDQAGRMWNFRIKVDVWSQGLDESIRQFARRSVRELFLSLAPRRLWCYLKTMRSARTGLVSTSELPVDVGRDPNIQDSFAHGPEDIMATGKLSPYTAV